MENLHVLNFMKNPKFVEIFQNVTNPYIMYMNIQKNFLSKLNYLRDFQ